MICDNGSLHPYVRFRVSRGRKLKKKIILLIIIIKNKNKNENLEKYERGNLERWEDICVRVLGDKISLLCLSLFGAFEIP